MKEKMLLCEICRREFKNYKSLSAHLITHKITSNEYYDKFFKKEGEGICPVCGKETAYLDLRRGYRKFCSCKCAKSGENNPSYGKHPSEETKKKISDAEKGENHPNYGKHRSEETKKKISDAHKRENNYNYGKHFSEETKKKMSDAKKGENHPNFGKHRSEETKKKISEANKGENHPNYKGGISTKEFKDAYGLEPTDWKKLAQ